MNKVVLSLYDYTGEAVKPWAIDGYRCICFDIQHSKVAPKIKRFQGGGSIQYVHADLYDTDVLSEIVKEYKGDCAFLFAWPVCTDMAVSGAGHFDNKRLQDALFQDKAVQSAAWCERVAKALECPYMMENPVSVLATQYRESNYRFDPFEYGGYIPEDEAQHPKWPEYIAPRDAYPKKTCLWTGGGFVMPEKRPVDCPEGYSDQHKKLGGKSLKTKNIRSATPRGITIAIHAANAVHLKGK